MTPPTSLAVACIITSEMLSILGRALAKFILIFTEQSNADKINRNIRHTQIARAQGNKTLVSRTRVIEVVIIAIDP